MVRLRVPIFALLAALAVGAGGAPERPRLSVEPPLPAWEPIPQGTPLVLEVRLAGPAGACLAPDRRRWRLELLRLDGDTETVVTRDVRLHGAGRTVRLQTAARALTATVGAEATGKSGRHTLALALHAKLGGRAVRLVSEPFQVWVVGEGARLSPAARDHALLAAPTVLRRRGRAMAALRAAEEAHRAHPEAGAVLLLLGELYAEHGYTDDALVAYEEAAHAYPTDADIIRKVAELAPKKGRQRKPRRMRDHEH